MQRTQTLTKLFKQLAELVAREAESNPAFAAELDAILAPLPKPTAKAKGKVHPVPDIFAEFEAKGEEEFSFWLRALDLATLKAIVKENGFDPSKTAHRWKEADKFVPLIVEQTVARLKRGSAFLSPSRSDKGSLKQNPSSPEESRG